MISVVAFHFLAGAVHGIYLCRAHALDPGGVRFDGVRWGNDRVGPFHRALVAGKPIRGSGGLPWRDLSSQSAGTCGYRRTQRSRPPSLLDHRFHETGLMHAIHLASEAL